MRYAPVFNGLLRGLFKSPTISNSNRDYNRWAKPQNWHKFQTTGNLFNKWKSQSNRRTVSPKRALMHFIHIIHKKHILYTVCPPKHILYVHWQNTISIAQRVPNDFLCFSALILVPSPYLLQPTVDSQRCECNRYDSSSTNIQLCSVFGSCPHSRRICFTVY